MLPDDAVDEIMLGSILTEQMQEHEDDIPNHFCIRWHLINGHNVARLEIYEDAWHYLETWSNLLKQLAQLANTNPTPTQVATWLKERGFIDVTPRDDPPPHPSRAPGVKHQAPPPHPSAEARAVAPAHRAGAPPHPRPPHDLEGWAFGDP